jgi:hypothetical protein
LVQIGQAVSGEDFLIHFLLNFLFLVTAAILVGGQGRQNIGL